MQTAVEIYECYAFAIVQILIINKVHVTTTFKLCCKLRHTSHAVLIYIHCINM